ncbi:MAG: hypothetical protein Q4B48_03915, partial [Syntrophomonadaceae bacterium]|nr:hypothetical protein [Syntrophomonadaceae bacterium]
TLTGTDINAEQLQAALIDYDDVVIGQGGIATLDESVEIPAGATLQNTGRMTIDEAQSLTIKGTLNNSGAIENDGTIVNNSPNSFNHKSGATIYGSGSIVNNGEMTISGTISRDLPEGGSGSGYSLRLMASATADIAGMTLRAENAAEQPAEGEEPGEEPGEENEEAEAEDKPLIVPVARITNSSSGTLTITAGANIHESELSAAINNRGKLNMDGGTITATGEEADVYGVYNYGKSAVFTMTGGAITATGGSAGAYGVWNYGAFNMDGGTITATAEIPDGLEYGVCNYGENATFTMSGGRVEGLWCGVYFDGGTFNFNAGTLITHREDGADGVGFCYHEGSESSANEPCTHLTGLTTVPSGSGDDDNGTYYYVTKP